MTFLTEQDAWEQGIRQLETSDPVQGGPDGIDNVAPRQLANRTRYLLRRLLDGFLTYAPDSGTKNNIVANLPQAVDRLVDGMEVRFRIAFANDDKCTFTPNSAAQGGIAPLPLYGGDGADLVGGELPVGAGVRARLDTSLNGAAGAWVIQGVTRGFARIATPPAGDKSTMAANMAAVFAASNGREVVDVSGAAATVLAKAQYGVAMLTGAVTAAKDLVFPAGRTGQWIVENDATGNFNITARVAGGAGVVLPIGTPVIVCSDGTSLKFASAGGQASLKPFSFSGIAGNSITIPGGYTPGALIVQRNGAAQEPGTSASPDFTATDGVNVVFTNPLTADEYVTVWVFATFNLANAVQKSGDAMGGPLALYAGSTVPAPAAGDNSTKLVNTAWFKSEQAAETNQGTAKVATQAQTNAGTDDTTIVTPKKLRAGFASSFGSTGYIAFPSWLGGLIFQWGAVTTSSSGYTSIAYPLAFPTQCFCVLANGLASSAVAANTTFSNAGATPKTSFSVATLNGSGAYAAQSTIWLAAGY